MGLFDTHTHYGDERFDEDRAALLAALPLPSEICPCGVEAILEQGWDLPSSEHALALAEQYPYIYAAAGVHPEECLSWNDQTEAALRRLLSRPKTVALGEIGLDRHWAGESCPFEKQKEIFARQLALGSELGMPVCVHDREAHGETFDLIRAHPGARGVLHAFSGEAELARQYVNAGWYIGLGGVLTFKNARAAVEVAGAVPLERVLLETDCPYMAPVPYRGERNDSRKAYAVAVKLAEIRGADVDEILAVTSENARTLFGI